MGPNDSFTAKGCRNLLQVRRLKDFLALTVTTPNDSAMKLTCYPINPCKTEDLVPPDTYRYTLRG